jgi:hypothetical protein
MIDDRMFRLAATMVLLALRVLGNDTFVHESAGNLMFVQNHDVTIQRERLVIGPPAPSLPGPTVIPIHVEYDLQSSSAQRIEARIGFPLAACSLRDYLSAKYGSFVTDSAATCVKEPKMSLNVDGRPVSGRWDFVFLRDGAPLGTVRPMPH